MVVSNNFNFPIQATGSNVGTWGALLNSGIFNPVDAILGGVLPVTISGSDVSLSSAQWQNAVFNLTGNLTADRSLILPLSPNSVGSATAVGGRFIVVNNTTGNFNLTVKTAVTTPTPSTGVTVPQGFAVELYSDGINVGYAAKGLPAYALASNGDPNGSLAGTAASVNTNASIAFDYANSIFYVCTFTGPATGVPGVRAVWTNVVSGSLPQPALQGRLTPVSGTAVVTGDSVAATSIYYTPYVGSWAAIHNTTRIIPFQFSQMRLTLSALAASNIYDVFLAYNTNVPVIGTGPSWSAGAAPGSIAPGSCARGTGVASTEIVRDATTGLWVNANPVSLTYNNGSISGTLSNVPAGQLIYLGSVFIDTTPGQVSCYRSYGGGGGGPPRKYGVWNAYNRVPIKMLGGSATANWSYGVNAWRQSAADVNNQVISFCGLAEEAIDIEFCQFLTENSSNGRTIIGVGLNSTTVPSGFTPINVIVGPWQRSHVVIQPALGINNINMIENNQNGAASGTYFGTQSNMLMVVAHNG